MFAMNRSWPGTSTKASLSPAQRGPGVAEVDRHAAPSLLGEPVRLHPGERAHQRRLAVVDMAGGGDDVHVRSRRRRRPTHRRRAPLDAPFGSGRHATQVEQAAAALHPADHGGLAAAQRRGVRLRAGLTAQPGSATPGCPAAADERRRRRPRRPRRGRAVRRAALRARAALPGRPRSARQVGAAGPRSVASSAARVSLSTRSARASGCRRSRSTSCVVPSSSPACGPPSSLSPLRGHHRRRPRAAPCRRPARRAAAGRGAADRCRCRPRPGGPSVGQFGDPDRRGEALDAEVARVHLEDAAGRPDRPRPRSRRPRSGWWSRPRAAGRRSRRSVRAAGTRRRSPPSRRG